MILLEILFFIALVGAVIYFAFFSKFAQRLARGAEKRNQEITSQPEDSSPAGIASRISDIEAAKARTANDLAARKASVADEAAKLDKLSVK